MDRRTVTWHLNHINHKCHELSSVPLKIASSLKYISGHDTKYCSDGKVTFLTDAKYFSCPNYLLADFVKVVLAKAKLCEVEIFHSQISKCS